MTDADIVFGKPPPVPLPSVEQLQELLPWSQNALWARPVRPLDTWQDFARRAAGILPFLWAGYPGSPFHWSGGGEDDAPVTPSDLFLEGDPDARFDDHARRIGPEAAAAAVILADAVESLDLATLPGPALLDGMLDAVARGDIDLRAGAEELLAAVRKEPPPPAVPPDLPDPTVLSHLLRHIHPPGPDRQAPLWPQVVHQARSIALFDRLVPRNDWREARMQLGRHGAAAAAIVAMARQSLELVTDPAGSLRGTVSMAVRRPATLGRSVRKLVKATARLSQLPEPGSLEVGVPSLECARRLYGCLHSSWPTGPRPETCSWHNLYDRMVRIHLPDHNRLGRKTDLSEAKALLGQRAFAVVAMLALSCDNRPFRHSALAELCFESAVRAASAGRLDLDALILIGDESGPSPAEAALAGPLKAVPDIHDIGGLIPATLWAPASDEPGQQYGWASVIENARRLGRDALGIDDRTWARLEERIEARGAAAAVLYAAPRPNLAPEPRLIDRIAGLKCRYDRDWHYSTHDQALRAIETEIDLAVIAALESCEFQPEAPELLPGPDVMKRHGPRSVRELVEDDAEPDWEELATAAHGLATARLGVSEDDWRRACRILGTRRAAAAALAAVAFEEDRNRQNFARVVFHEATRPGSLPELLRSNWLLHRSENSFVLSDPPSLEPAP